MTLRKRRRNFLNLLQKEVGTQKGGGGGLAEKRGESQPWRKLFCLILQKLATNLHLHLQVSSQDICLVSLIFDIKLNTLTLISLARSGMHNLAYGSLLLYQLPLHLFTRILQE